MNVTVTQFDQGQLPQYINFCETTPQGKDFAIVRIAKLDMCLLVNHRGNIDRLVDVVSDFLDQHKADNDDDDDDPLVTVYKLTEVPFDEDGDEEEDDDEEEDYDDDDGEKEGYTDIYAMD